MGKQREASRRLPIGMWPSPASRARAGDYLRRAVLGLLAWVLLVAGVLKTFGLVADAVDLHI